MLQLQVEGKGRREGARMGIRTSYSSVQRQREVALERTPKLIK